MRLKLAAVVLLLMVGLPLGVLGLAASESGSRWLLSWAVALAPVEVKIGDMRGTLLEHISLHDTRFRDAGQDVRINSLDLTWRPFALAEGLIHIQSLRIKGVHVSAAPATEARKAPGPLPDIRLPIRIQLDNALLEDMELLQGEARHRVERIRLSIASTHDSDLIVKQFEARLDSLSIEASGEFGGRQPHPLKASARWRASLPTGETVAGGGDIQGDMDTLRINQRLSAPFPLSLRGSIARLTDSPQLNLRGQWWDARWPLSGEASYQSEAGHFQLEGGPDDYRLGIDGRFEGADIPSLDLNLKARGSTTGIALEELQVAGLGGQAEARGRIDWAEHISWDLQLAANGVNPACQWPDWPGRLALLAHSKGSVRDGRPSATARIQNLSGDLRGYPVAANGDLAIDGAVVTVPSLTLNSGSNTLNLAGSLGDSLALDVDIDAPDLAPLWPGLSGAITGSLALHGKRDDPEIQSHLTGSTIAYRDSVIDKLDAQISLLPNDPDASSARIAAHGIRIGAQHLQEVVMDAAGNLTTHRIDVSASSGQFGQLDLAATGKYADARWSGTLESLELDLRQLAGEPWRLTEPVALELGPQRARWVRTCLTQNAAALCTAGLWEPRPGLAVEGRLNALPLALFQAYLPDDIRVEGSLEGSFKASTAEAGVTAQTEIKPSAGALIYMPKTGEPYRLGYENALLRAKLDPGMADLDWTATIAEDGHLAGKLRLDLKSDPDNPPIDGDLELRFPDLGLIAPFVPQLEELHGSVGVKGTLAGLLLAPQIDGKAELRDVQAQIPQLGLELHDMQLSAANQATDIIAFQGQARSGKGQVRIEGTVRLNADQGWPVNATMQGADFQVVRLPETEATVSPDLKLASRSGAVEVTGKLAVPLLRIELKELPRQAAATSPDEIIIGPDGTPPADTAARPMRVTSRVELELGDDVSFSGFGLETGLGGNLMLRTTPGQPPFAEGELALENGRYQAYGQDLTLQQGTLIFAGPPDNPRLDLRATREAGEVTAGVEIGGTLEKPESRVFSEPPMSEAEALSYLLTGNPLSAASTAGAASLGQAALALGLKNSKSITQEIAHTVGIDELSLSGGEQVEDSSLLIGKYLTPDLYVRYTFGLFDSQGKVTLRYDLTDHVSVEAHSGEAQGMDLMYSIERD